MFGLFGKKKPRPEILVVARLNIKVMPMDRGTIFEDPLNEALEKIGLGEVTGGGTQMSADGEIEFCDVEIALFKDDPETLDAVIELLNASGAPKGSMLIGDPEKDGIPFGIKEGMAVYLNGTDLPDSVYAECDSNLVYEEFEKLLGDHGFILHTWQGPTETGLYIYGPSFETMKSKIGGFLDTYPLCKKARVVQTA